MVQISKRKLDKGIEHEMYRQFWDSVSKLNSPETAAHFFSDLLSETEKLMLAKRYMAAILVMRNKTSKDIKQAIHISNSTVGSVSAWVKNAKPLTKEILTKISKEKSWEGIWDRIDSIIDKVPPKYGTNWKKAGEKKLEYLKKRSARQNLR